MAYHVKLNRQYGRKARCASKNETHAQLLFEQCMSLLFFEGECQMKRTYTQSVEEVLHDLGVGVEGLSMAEAQQRLAKYNHRYIHSFRSCHDEQHNSLCVIS